MLAYLETSSYLPLIWTTPYTKSVVDLLESRRQKGTRFALQHDCIREAAGYLSFKDDWRYHPAVRIRNLIRNVGESNVAKLPFPSTATQLLLGGNIWPQAQYLNFVRHTGFFFIDLLDGLHFDEPVAGLLEFAGRIDARVSLFRSMFEEHAGAKTIKLPTRHILPYWGKWYLPQAPFSFEIEVVKDARPYDLASDKLRDVYHYDCALNASQKPDEVIVANTGFKRNVKSHFGRFDIPLICAETATSTFFADALQSSDS